ncbi:MAG: precorrin-8X methylmutase [Cyanobacteriota bacterium]|nr:precorrin-8X methylmutase [Cyanobacteriota bacterium]
MISPIHPITAASFALIDQEIGEHAWSEPEYGIVRRAIHATADFELRDLFYFSPTAIAAGIAALQAKCPVIVDVRMVAAGVVGGLQRQGIPCHCALDTLGDGGIAEGQTQTATGMLALARAYPEGLYLIGNAPTALLAIVEQIRQQKMQPALVVGVPVGFVAVQEAKQALASLEVPQIRVLGRKGGSPVAAAILNALLTYSIGGT